MFRTHFRGSNYSVINRKSINVFPVFFFSRRIYRIEDCLCCYGNKITLIHFDTCISELLLIELWVCNGHGRKPKNIQVR